MPVPEGSAAEAGGWLGKAEVNAHYYGTVAGEIAFVTEASAGRHAAAVARLIALHAKTTGKRHVRVLELAANNCAFQRLLVQELRVLVQEGVAELDRVDYVAVEYARGSLEAAADWEEELGTHDRVLRADKPQAAVERIEPDRPTLVALLVTEGPPSFNVGLVHAEANQFVHGSAERFDFAIVNELLDDLPCRVFYADGENRPHEVVPYARAHPDGWTVRVAAEDVEDGAVLDGARPATLTVRSPESVELVTGVARLLGSGGMLLLHDYGFAERFTKVDQYAQPPPSVPSFVTMDFPEGSGHGFPRSFFRVYGNDRLRVVQVTNDVNFAELAAVLEGEGAVTVVAHGNTISNRPGGSAEKGDGVFLGEFPELGRDDDLAGLLADLHSRQLELREAYVRDHTGGRTSVFLDLIFVKS